MLSGLVSGQLSRNGLFAASQSLVVAFCVFLSYRLVVTHVGLERLGVWSLLLAGATVARIGDISGGGALARFVAAGLGSSQRTRDIVHTVMLTTVGLNVAFGLLMWLGAPHVLPLFIPQQYLSDAHLLVPFIVSSTVLSAMAVAVVSAIDGAQRADQRAMIVASASLVFLAANWLLVPRHGVVGFGIAYILQHLTTLVAGWLILRIHVPGLGWLPIRWRRDVFAETAGYALKLNAIGLIGLLFEPLAKLSFNHAGGPALVGLYELASRLVLQARAVVISTATPLVPAFAARHQPNDTSFQILLEKSMRIAAWTAVGITLATLSAAPIMSFLVLSKVSTELLQMNAALTAGWAINVLSVPIYFAAQAQGVLRWNFTSHALIAASVLAAVVFLVPLIGPPGIIAGITIGLVVSSIIVLVGNARALGLTMVILRLRCNLVSASALVALLSLSGWILATL